MGRSFGAIVIRCNKEVAAADVGEDVGAGKRQGEKRVVAAVSTSGAGAKVGRRALRETEDAAAAWQRLCGSDGGYSEGCDDRLYIMCRRKVGRRKGLAGDRSRCDRSDCDKGKKRQRRSRLR
ncbi:hypothetical protein GW17_00036731 [Ensete ventricosum]|nr:hypothetical protein GW17_00036731 [Ensete ventricosum]